MSETRDLISGEFLSSAEKQEKARAACLATRQRQSLFEQLFKLGIRTITIRNHVGNKVGIAATVPYKGHVVYGVSLRHPDETDPFNEADGIMMAVERLCQSPMAADEEEVKCGDDLASTWRRFHNHKSYRFPSALAAKLWIDGGAHTGPCTGKWTVRIPDEECNVQVDGLNTLEDAKVVAAAFFNGDPYPMTFQSRKDDTVFFFYGGKLFLVGGGQ